MTMDGEDRFPRADVEACITDSGLQQEHADDATDPRMRESLEYLRAQALRDGASEHARWIYFCSPKWTWEQECGREGWLLYEPETGTQHAFLMTAMN